MGHADKIYNEYYRQPIVNRDIINMSKLLEIAQGNNVTISFQSTILDEIDASLVDVTNIMDPQNSPDDKLHSSEDEKIPNKITELSYMSLCKKMIYLLLDLNKRGYD